MNGNNGARTGLNNPKIAKYLRPPQVGPLAAGLGGFGSTEAAANIETETKIWIADEVEGYVSADVVARGVDDITVKARNSEGFLERRIVPIEHAHEANPFAFEFCEDMASLTHLNEAAVLYNLRRRFSLDLIQTFSGLFCVSVNPWRWLAGIYSEEVMRMYRQGQQNLPPHIYSIAYEAYNSLTNGGGDQSILITGESGAGKTENTKKIIHYFALVVGTGQEVPGDREAVGGLEDQILEMNPVLEAFGNAKTTQNDNSSRFGKFIRIKFNDTGSVSGAEVENYLLEKSRVVSQNHGERSFHIFYQLLSAGSSEKMKDVLRLKKPAEEYRFVSQGECCEVLSVDDETEMRHTEKALGVLGFSGEEKQSVYQMAAACILLGELKFTERQGMDQTFVDGADEIDDVCCLLGLNPRKFGSAITEPTVKIGEQLVRKSQNLEKTLFSVNALAKSLYERTFNWIVQRCNASLSRNANSRRMSVSSTGGRGQGERYIGVLDIAGFEILSVNSFEQLCINYTNERLQQFFNHFMFIKEQAEYEQEEITWDYVDYGMDLQASIDLIEKPLGILSLLEEECMVPKGSDAAFAEKLYQNHLSKTDKFGKPKPSKRIRGISHFSVEHYAGVVSYNVDGWRDKNKDPLNECMLEFLRGSTNKLMQTLFKISGPNGGGGQNGNPGRRRSSVRSLAFLTVSSVYKEQLQNLLATLNSTSPHFIRCIVPNYERIPGLIDGPLVLHQLRCNGVLEGIRICRRGYPNRLPFDEFVNRYKLFDPSIAHVINYKEACRTLCQTLGLDVFTQYQIGVTKIFCRVGVVGQLEQRRNERLSSLVVGIQAQIRWYCEQMRVDVLMADHDARLTIQRNVRKWAVMKRWPWFRLMLLVKPSIRTQADMQAVEEIRAENEQLNDRLTQYEYQTKELKARVRELEDKVDEMLMQNALKDQEIVIMKEEMQKQENLLQHLEENVSKQERTLSQLTSTLTEEQLKIQQLKDTNSSLEEDLSYMKRSIQKERKAREELEEYNNQSVAELTRLQGQIRDIQNIKISLEQAIGSKEKDNALMTHRLKDLESNLDGARLLMKQQQARVDEVELLLKEERASKRKLEKARQQAEDDFNETEEQLRDLQQIVQKQHESSVRKDARIEKLEKQMVNTNSQYEAIVVDLKRRQTTAKKQLQEQLEELRKKTTKMESENKQLKARQDSLDRDYDSDYTASNPNRSSSLSRMGVLGTGYRTRRSYSTQLESFSFKQKLQEEFRKLSYGSSAQPAPVVRSPSNSDVMMRRIEALDRELRELRTDKRLLSRELDVVKRNLTEESEEREAHAKHVIALRSDVDQMNNSLAKEEHKNEELDRQLKKAQSLILTLQAKHNANLLEKDAELDEQKKLLKQRLESVTADVQLKGTHLHNMEKTYVQLQQELQDTVSELGRAYDAIAQLEKANRTQDRAIDTWGSQYRVASGELESLRDENLLLRTKLRRQAKELDQLKERCKGTIEEEATNLEEEIRKLKEEIEGNHLSREHTPSDNSGESVGSLSTSTRRSSELLED